MLKIEVIIAAFREGILGLSDVLPLPVKDTSYLVIHQLGNEPGPIPQKWMEAEQELLYRPDLRIMQFWETGVSQNRNRGLENAQGDICLICDEDVRLQGGFDARIREAWTKQTDASVITFQAKWGGQKKHYRASPFKHDRKSAAKVSSVEITFKRSAILGAKIQFDMRFGLGSEFPTGEEFIFLTEVLRHKLLCYYHPLILGTHPQVSSGATFSPALARAKGALFARVFGWPYPLVNLWFALRKWPAYHRQMSLTKFLLAEFRGSNDLKNYEHN